MGIGRDSRHKHYKTGGRSKARPRSRGEAAMLDPRGWAYGKLGVKRIRSVRGKYRALRLDAGNYAWGSENVAKKVRILDVVYNATSNELVRTKTLLKNTVVQIDAHPFMQFYLKKYGQDLGKKKKGAAAGDKTEKDEAKVSRHVLFKQKARASRRARAGEEKAKSAAGSSAWRSEQFQSGRLLACIASRPGQCGRADGYVLEGEAQTKRRGRSKT
ncbi:40S ribosomal protein S8 [Durusdinium trenchii]|uniref:40S ribosomal protein S8 n=1 Tax=Durusdinium trenchii TaxID=1381693 RepID=A0ABP0IYC2_9DINO